MQTVPLAGVISPFIRKLCVSAALAVLQGVPVLAQTNQQLLQDRLISPAVFDLLKRQGAHTPHERLLVIQAACRARQLAPIDCGVTRSHSRF